MGGVAVAGLLGFGLGALNYTKAHTIEQHRAWARRRDLPEPSARVYYAGLTCLVLGSLIAGHALGQRKARA